VSNEIKDSFAIARTLLEDLEERFQRNELDTGALRATLAKIIGAAHRHGIPDRASKKPPRGVGYDLHEAQIVASIDEHGSLPKAVQAHYPDAGPEWLDAVTRRLRGRMKEIGNLIGE
jgi:hypothetical protein